jgi:mono/diheme cytochrome c family protein
MPQALGAIPLTSINRQQPQRRLARFSAGYRAAGPGISQLETLPELGVVENCIRDILSRRGVTSMLHPIAAIVLGVMLSVSVGALTARADTAAGGRLAQRWCASCHVDSDTQTGPISQGPPSFRTIARSGLSTDHLRAFLSHPHGAMPDLALTNSEIDDLIRYIQSLR